MTCPFGENCRGPSGLVLVGEAPGRLSNPSMPLSGAATRRRLEWLFGIKAYDRALKFNLFHAWPGKAGKGDRFDVEAARPAAGAIKQSLYGVAVNWTVVILGFRAARAFTSEPSLLAYFKPWSFTAEVTYVIVPHTSGINRWWNDEANRRRAIRFCRKVARETEI